LNGASTHVPERGAAKQAVERPVNASSWCPRGLGAIGLPEDFACRGIEDLDDRLRIDDLDREAGAIG
jgi:hypothetical protein